MDQFVFRIVLCLAFVGCRATADQFSLAKDITVYTTNQPRERTFVAFVGYVIPERNFPDLIMDDAPSDEVPANPPVPNIRELLDQAVKPELNCWQLVKMSNSLVLEVFPIACPASGWIDDYTQRSFYLIVDADLEGAASHSQQLIHLRKDGYLVGNLESRPGDLGPRYFLNDLFCDGLFSDLPACDVTIRDGRFIDFSVNRSGDFSNQPEFEKRFGYSTLGTLKECPDPGSFVTTEGSTFATLCNYMGFDHMVCTATPSEEKYLCEGNLGAVSFDLSDESESRVMEAIHALLPVTVSLSGIETAFYVQSFEDPEVLYNEILVELDFDSSLDENQRSLAQDRILEQLSQSDAFQSIELETTARNKFRVSDFKIEILMPPPDGFGI